MNNCVKEGIEKWGKEWPRRRNSLGVFSENLAGFYLPSKPVEKTARMYVYIYASAQTIAK